MENVLRWVIIKSYNNNIELPRDHIISLSENHSFFGLKKELILSFYYIKKRKQKFNISMLSIKTIFFNRVFERYY